MSAETASRDAAAPAPRPALWLGVTGALLLATLLAAAFLQVRQHALLNATVQYQDDYLVISLYQLETEYLRLREQLQHNAENRAERGDDALQLRYDIFVSRVGLLDSERARRLLSATPVAEDTMRALDAFVRHADVYLGAGAAAARPLGPQAARTLLGELTPVGDPIHRLMLEASHQVARQIVERQSQVRQHNAVALGLTAFLSCMVLVFGVVVMRQMRALGERHQRLERLADELRAARREAEAADAAKSEFLADTSHELRTPLHGLMGMLTLLRDAPRSPQAGTWLATADDSARHLLRLLDDLLDLSKLESGTLALSPAPVHLTTLVRETRALMLPAARAKGLELITEIDPALPARAMLDATRVRQVLYNLLANAVKYSERGAVVLRCAPAPVDGDPTATWLEFGVADTGIGMDADTLSRLFRRNTRADDPRARRQPGAGLGLAISRKLAALMGGEIVVRSTPGAGSMFLFRWPLQPVDDAASAAAAPPAQAQAQPVGLRVLVVDDHPTNRLVLAAQLERLGHRWREAGDGAEALELLRHDSVDLVLMDVHMPVMDGVAATAALRALPPPAGTTPVLALTADVFADTRERCLRAGAVEVLTKPLSMTALAEALARHARHPAAAGPEAPAPLAPQRQDDEPPGAGPGGAATLAGAIGAGTVAGLLDPGTVAGLLDAGTVAGLLDAGTVAGVRDLMGGPQLPVLYAGFFDQASDAARRMRDAVNAADPEALGRSAHAVKGAALNLGLPALAEAAARLSHEAGAMAATPLASAVEQFEALVDATRRTCVAEGLIGG